MPTSRVPWIAAGVSLLLGSSIALVVGAAGPRGRAPALAASPPPALPSGAPTATASGAPDEPEEVPSVRRYTSWRSPTDRPPARIDEARASKLGVVKGLFASAAVAFPPAQLLLRAFKEQRRLEVWAASRAGSALMHVTTYEICAASGSLGPKRKKGDARVPEGFYTLTDYSPATPYYLAMLVSYPNLSDRILGDKVDPGGGIMIHGRCASAGCLAMSDESVQEIWVTATALRSAGGVVQVHIYPSRDMESLLAATDEPELRAFWGNLKEGLDWFEAHRRLPVIHVDAAGRYQFH